MGAVAAGTVTALAHALTLGALGLFAHAFGEVFCRGIIVAAEKDGGIAVACQPLPIVLEHAFDLGDALQNNVAADVPASANCQNIFEVFGQSDVRKLVHHEPHMDRQRTAVFRRGIRQPEQPVKKLGVQHGGKEIVGFIIVGNDAENSPLFLAQHGQEHGIGAGHGGELRGVEHIQVGGRRNQNRLQGFRRAQLKGLELLDCRVEGVALLQLIHQDFQRVIFCVGFTDLAILNHVHQCGKILFFLRCFIVQVQDQGGNQQRRGIVPELSVPAAGGVFRLGIVDDGIGQLDGILIRFNIVHGIVIPLEMYQVDDGNGDALLLIQTSKGTQQLPLGV